MIVRDDQNIFDVTLEKFGSLGFTFTMINDNGLTFNSKIKSGQEIIINNNGIGDNKIKNFVTLQDVKFNNNQGVSVPPIEAGDFGNDFNLDF